LAPGKVYFDYGPSSIVVMADKDGEPLTDLCRRAFDVIDASLAEIAAALSWLRRCPAQIPAGQLSGLPRRMLEAALVVGEPTLTPMAAVAGCVSDAVADWLFAQGASRVIANNGGDVALRLAPGTSAKIGLMTSLWAGQVDQAVTIKAEDGIGGVATSGLGGRSLTRGVARGVSAFARRCILADALATHLANCSYIPSDQVLTMKAGEVDPNSDIGDLAVVVDVGRLDHKLTKQALRQVEREARRQKEKGNLIAACARVQDDSLNFEMPAEACAPDGQE
jgi:ApbE superfamily uncharacterized protein (UPF0280 family)